jgi:Fur family peroxide stress response transcriptional regulator
MTAASLLAKRGLSILMIEQQNKPGGTCTSICLVIFNSIEYTYGYSLSIKIFFRKILPMPDSKARFDELITALREREFRLTPQRVELVRLIAASDGHPSAAQLYSKINTQFPTMSQATVYKTLALLKEMNQVLEIDLREDRHYDGIRPHPHPHLICMQCNKIMDGEMDLDPSSLSKLEKTSGFKIIRPQITLYGLCSDCRQSS